MAEVVAEDPAYCLWVLREAEARLGEPQEEPSGFQVTGVLYKPSIASSDVLPRRYADVSESSEATADGPSARLQKPIRLPATPVKVPTASHGLREMAKWLTANASHLKDSPPAASATMPRTMAKQKLDHSPGGLGFA